MSDRSKADKLDARSDVSRHEHVRKGIILKSVDRGRVDPSVILTRSTFVGDERHSDLRENVLVNVVFPRKTHEIIISYFLRDKVGQFRTFKFRIKTVFEANVSIAADVHETRIERRTQTLEIKSMSDRREVAEHCEYLVRSDFADARDRDFHFFVREEGCRRRHKKTLSNIESVLTNQV